MKRTFLFFLGLALASLSCRAEDLRSSLEQTPKNEARGQSLVSGSLSAAGKNLVCRFSTEDAPTVWTHVYLDTDGKAATGFRPSQDTENRMGMDFLVEGETLYTWSGKDDQRGWHWDRTDTHITRVVNGNEVTIEIPLSELGLKTGQKVAALYETMTENFAENLDLLPREGGPLEVVVPAHAAVKAVSPPVADARNLFKKVNSYACYYGKGGTEAMKGRDAVIVETKNQTPESIDTLKKNGALTIGYISAGEDGELRKGDGKGPGGYDSAYYDRNHDDKPDKNETWHSYFTNAGSEAWINYFLSEARKLREEYGVDGFFLDTVETFTLYTENRKPMVALIERLRKEYPDAIIVINRGWNLLPELAGTVDGMMYESFTSSYDFSTKSYVRMRPSALDEGREIYEKFIKPAQEKSGLVVLALDYAGGPDDAVIQDSFDRAVSFGMIPEVSNIYLDQIYPHHFTGTKSEAWTKNFLTPESMSYVTKDPVNGFPTGTRIVPSSIYADYEVAPVVDGQKDKASLSWRNRAWASAEKLDEHWLEFQLPKSQPVSGLKVVWATDNGEAFPSRNFSVQVLPAAKDATEWKTVWSTNSNTSKTILASFQPTDAQRIRIAQQSEGGSSARPNLMWIEQVEMTK